MIKRHIFWMLALASATVWANGSLKDVQGDVRVDTKAAALGSQIVPGSVVKTGPNSRAVIRFDDGQVVALGSNSEFKVREYAYDKADPGKDNIVLDVFRGTMRAISGLLGQRNPSRFALYTPTATAGIRGTDFTSSVVDYVGQDGVTRQQTYFNVQSGQVQVTTKAGNAVVGSGQAVLTTPSGAITPVPVSGVPVDPSLANAQVASAGGAGSGTAGAAAVTGETAGIAAVAVPVVGVAGAIAGVVAATSDNSTVTGHHGAVTHGTSSHHTSGHH